MSDMYFVNRTIDCTDCHRVFICMHCYAWGSSLEARDHAVRVHDWVAGPHGQDWCPPCAMEEALRIVKEIEEGSADDEEKKWTRKLI